MLAKCRPLAPEPLLLILHGQRDKAKNRQMQSFSADETEVLSAASSSSESFPKLALSGVVSSKELINKVCSA